MEDFNALAISLGLGMADVRGCLVLSRDGLVLGAHPAESERATTRAWIRFATIGDPERGFVQFGTETWCYVRRAPYAGFALAGPHERAGLVIDHMERVLEAAEERRSRQEGPGEGEPATETETETETGAATMVPRSEPTPYLDLAHPAPDPLVIDAPPPIETHPSTWESPDEPPRPFRWEPETIGEPVGDDAETAEPPADAIAELGVDVHEAYDRPSWERTPPVAHPETGHWPLRDQRPEVQGRPETFDEADEASGAGPEADPETGLEPEDQAEDKAEDKAEAEAEDDDVDRFSLAREFGRLLQGGDGSADG